MEKLEPIKIKEKFPEIQMDQYTEQVPGLNGVFDPAEEIRSLRTIPKEKREEAKKEIREKINIQMEGFGFCRNEIEQRIENNPDVTKEELMDIVRQFASVYGFSESQIILAARIIIKFIENRNKVKKLLAECTTPKALIKRIFNYDVKPEEEGMFSMEETPYCVKILCSQGQVEVLHKAAGGRKYNETDLINGFARNESNSNNPSIIVVSDSGESEKDSITTHEIQHVKTMLVDEILISKKERKSVHKKLEEQRTVSQEIEYLLASAYLKFKRIPNSELLAAYKVTKDTESKELLLEEFLLEKRTEALIRARDELISMFSEESVRENYNVFYPGSPYDYLKSYRENPTDSSDTLWKEKAGKIIVSEYNEIINEAIQAFTFLINGGFTKEEAISLLTGIPIERWGIAVKRVIEERDLIFQRCLEELRSVGTLGVSGAMEYIVTPDLKRAGLIKRIIKSKKEELETQNN